jgi:tetratricopeptide (TPR) repeat protein
MRLAAVAAACFLITAPVNAQTTGLTAGPQLARVYDVIFDASFSEVPALLEQTCGSEKAGLGAELSVIARSARVEARRAKAALGADVSAVARSAKVEAQGAKAAPAEACQLLDVISLWWQIQLDPKNRVHDEQFRTRVDAVITAIESWTEREPTRGEAWFYLGGAYGARAQFRVLREERLAAARDGKRIKTALERALAIDPSLRDAYFGIGLYHYYADVAPAALTMLRWLLLLPGGDRLEGMREMLRARSEGQLLQSEADYQLHLIYLWYEKQPERALQLLRGLRDRHPRNPLFVQLIAGVQDVYLHDLQATRETWHALLESALADRVAEPEMTEATARLGLASVLDRLSESESALHHLHAIIALNPTAPLGIVAHAQLQLGHALDHLGRRDEAISAYRAAIESVPAGDPDRIVRAARAGMRGR